MEQERDWQHRHKMRITEAGASSVASGLEAVNDTVVSGNPQRYQTKIHTSVSRRLQAAFSHCSASLSFVTFSTSSLCLASLNLEASKAPLNDATCVCAETRVDPRSWKVEENDGDDGMGADPESDGDDALDADPGVPARPTS